MELLTRRQLLQKLLKKILKKLQGKSCQSCHLRLLPHLRLPPGGPASVPIPNVNTRSTVSQAGHQSGATSTAAKSVTVFTTRRTGRRKGEKGTSGTVRRSNGRKSFQVLDLSQLQEHRHHLLRLHGHRHQLQQQHRHHQQNPWPIRRV